MVAHEHILTNYGRNKWSVGISHLCNKCGVGDETVIYVLRDCTSATQVWLRLVSSNCIFNYFFPYLAGIGYSTILSTIFVECVKQTVHQILWQHAGTCRPGETKKFLKKAFNVQLTILMWFSRWLKRWKAASTLHEFLINMTLSSLDLAHQQGVKKLHIEIESDSKVLIYMVTKKNNFNRIILYQTNSAVELTSSSVSLGVKEIEAMLGQLISTTL